MLNKVIDFIDQQVSILGYIPSMYGMVDRIRIDGKELPASYCKNEWKHLNEFTEGFFYHRLIGEIDSEIVDEEETVSCQRYEIKNYPMRAVFCKEKKAFQNDVYLQERIANELIGAIRLKNSKSVCIELSADIVEAVVNSTDIDVYSVFEKEYNNIEQEPLECVLISVDYTITIQGATECFEKMCDI